MLQNALHHKNPFVRKASMKLLGGVKRALPRANEGDLAELPPAIANSFPKSGTHLLDQIVGALPGRVNYGEFLSSMTSSLTFRRRADADVAASLARSRPGEIVRAHLFYGDQTAAALRGVNAAHYFIYRDPRDVVVSEAHYLRTMNRWHRLHKVFKQTATVEDAVRLAITGLAGRDDYFYPDIGERFRLYTPWIGNARCCAVRFEDLTGENAESEISRMAGFYAESAADQIDTAELAQVMRAAIAPEKSHTFRSGKRGGWREALTPELRRLFEETTNGLLVELGYEPNRDWADQA